MLVTGNGVYKYYKLKDNGLKPEPHQMNKKESHISSNYTCHAWLPADGRIVVCTDSGELLLCESNGEYKMLLSCSPQDGFYIESIITNTKGFMISGDHGNIMLFEKTEEPKNPYTKAAQLPSGDPKKEETKENA